MLWATITKQKENGILQNTGLIETKCRNRCGEMFHQVTDNLQKKRNLLEGQTSRSYLQRHSQVLGTSCIQNQLIMISHLNIAVRVREVR